MSTQEAPVRPEPPVDAYDQAPKTLPPPEGQALEPAFSGTKAERLEFVKAFIAAQMAYGQIKRNTKVEMRKDGKLLYTFWYADLNEIIDKTRAALAANGILMEQPTSSRGKYTVVTTRLSHIGGWVQETSWEMPTASDNKNAAGDITYVRRYLAGPALNVAGDLDADDSGEVGQIPDGLIVDAWNTAALGSEAYQDWFMSLDESHRSMLASRFKVLKEAVDNADREIRKGKR